MEKKEIKVTFKRYLEFIKHCTELEISKAKTKEELEVLYRKTDKLINKISNMVFKSSIVDLNIIEEAIEDTFIFLKD